MDNWRWQDVPFYLRTGKRLPRQVSEIAIQFRAVPHQSFPPEATLDWQPSRLVMSIQPDEGIVLRFQAKHPGPKMVLQPVDMRFNYRESFATPSPDAYVTLLWDVINNDATLFMRADQVEAAWRLLMPVLDAWKASSAQRFSELRRRHLGAGRHARSAGSTGPQLAGPGGIGRKWKRGALVVLSPSTAARRASSSPLYQTGDRTSERLHGKVDRIGLPGTILTFHDPFRVSQRVSASRPPITGPRRLS